MSPGPARLDWDRVVALALALPDTSVESFYGAPAVKTNGRAFVSPGREAGSFHLALDRDLIEILKAAEPETYWQTPHYEGWPGLLVRYDSPDPEGVAAMIARSHAWTRSRPKPKARKKG